MHRVFAICAVHGDNAPMKATPGDVMTAFAAGGLRVRAMLVYNNGRETFQVGDAVFARHDKQDAMSCLCSVPMFMTLDHIGKLPASENRVQLYFMGVCMTQCKPGQLLRINMHSTS